jgi:hypothetical protein
MGLWTTIKNRFQPSTGTPAEDASGWQVLRHLGVAENFVIWAQREGKDLAGTWDACPRADWLVSLAASAGVDRRSVVEAVEECVHKMPGDGEQKRAALIAAEQWLEQLCEVEELCRALGQALNEALDTDPELGRARLARHKAVTRRFPEERINADLAERNLLMGLAARIRRRVPFDEVRKAIWGDEPRDTPYR